MFLYRVLTPDNDSTTHYKVTNGWNNLALALHDAGARSVGVRMLPPGDKCGAGDYIRDHGQREYLKLPIEFPAREDLEVYRTRHRSDVGNAHGSHYRNAWAMRTLRADFCGAWHVG